MYKTPLHLVRAVREGRFLYLLLILLAYLLLTPFLQEIVRFRFLYSLFLTINLVAGIYAIAARKTQTVIAVSLAVPMVILTWAAYSNDSDVLYLLANLFTLFFLGVIIISILSFVFMTRKVTHHVIFGTISVYLLIGIAWSILYAILEFFSSGSFSKAPDSGAHDAGFYVYFSFVTLTTLGYGDITPLTSKAQALVIGEALVGQIYMTVLVAWLVGLFVSQNTLGEAEHDR